jgi:hypothetical protein
MPERSLVVLVVERELACQVEEGEQCAAADDHCQYDRNHHVQLLVSFPGSGP